MSCSESTKKDPSKVLTLARDLVRVKKYQESLENLIWYRDNAVKIKPSQYGVRHSFFIGQYVELALLYEPAMADLKKYREGLRDKILNKMDSELLGEYLQINIDLNDTLDTLEFFRKVDKSNKLLIKISPKLFQLLKDGKLTKTEKAFFYKEEFIEALVNKYYRSLAFSIKEKKYSDEAYIQFCRNLFINEVNAMLQFYMGHEKKDLFKLTKEVAVDYIGMLKEPEIESKLISWE